MIRRVMKIAIGAVAATVFVLGLWCYVTPAPAASAGCICPQIYAPVTCSNGKTYPNACVASCQHAKNCVPAGGI